MQVQEYEEDEEKEKVSRYEKALGHNEELKQLRQILNCYAPIGYRSGISKRATTRLTISSATWAAYARMLRRSFT